MIKGIFGFWNILDCISILLPKVLPQVLWVENTAQRHSKFLSQMEDQQRQKVGDLKLVRPNVRRYKLLMLSYLQMFNRFPFAETEVQ
jgi:hypothetical protein